MAHHQYFPVEFIHLQEEMLKHPDVVNYMGSVDSPYLEDRLAALCTFLDILVDDNFDVDELSDLAQMITNKLYERRTGICLTH